MDQQIHKLGIGTLLLTGFAASTCVLFTYRGTTELDYTPLIIRGSLAEACRGGNLLKYKNPTQGKNLPWPITNCLSNFTA
ncbi:MAG: isochorismatase family protein [Anaerolineales bacterium]|nr:isochorismatase family protein [Anaerolineales bacterium]